MIKDRNSVFYSADKINRTLLNKSRTSSSEKEKAFYKIYIRLEDQEIIYEDNEEKERIPFYTPFIEQKQDIDRSLTVYRLNNPMQFFHADLADIRFISKSAVDIKYALLCVDLFWSKVYVYLMKKKKKKSLARKRELFYPEIKPKQDQKQEMIRMQTNVEFLQKEIKKLNQKYNIDMFSTKSRGGKSFAAEQKIREFKKLLLKSKQLHKVTKTGRLDLRKLIRNALQKMNNVNSQKYGVPPKAVQKKTLQDKNFRQVDDFHRMVRVSRDAERYKRNDIRFDHKT